MLGRQVRSCHILKLYGLGYSHEFLVNIAVSLLQRLEASNIMKLKNALTKERHDKQIVTKFHVYSVLSHSPVCVTCSQLPAKQESLLPAMHE